MSVHGEPLRWGPRREAPHEAKRPFAAVGQVLPMMTSVAVSVWTPVVLKDGLTASAMLTKRRWLLMVVAPVASIAVVPPVAVPVGGSPVVIHGTVRHHERGRNDLDSDLRASRSGGQRRGDDHEAYDAIHDSPERSYHGSPHLVEAVGCWLAYSLRCSASVVRCSGVSSGVTVS